MLKYIYYSTLLGVFSGALIYRAAFDIRLFYLVIVSNLVLIGLAQYLWRIPRWLVWMTAYLFLSGVIGIARGTDRVPQFAKEFVGITVNAFFYYHFFKLFRNDYGRIFGFYVRTSYIVSLIGFPILLIESAYLGQFARMHSITLEPAAYCELVLPAYFWYLANYVAERRHGLRLLLFSIAIALSASSVGYICVLAGLLLLPFKKRKMVLAAPVLIGILLIAGYSVSTNFRVRIDDTLASLVKMEVGGSNLSTFASISNLLVTERVFQESPILGNGLGSHVISHERFIADIPGIDALPESWRQVNATEAASLTLRVISEQGLLGLGLLFYFVIRFHAGWRGKHSIISNALLTTFLLKLIRGGIYFGPEQFFFIFIYLLNGRAYRATQFSASHETKVGLVQQPSALPSPS